METWKDIPWYEWLYQASTLGRIKSLTRKVKWRRWALQLRKEKILKPQKRWVGFYYSVDLCKNWKIKSTRVNRIIWQVFLLLDIKDTEIKVCHKNDYIYDNRVENLFLWTHKDNMNDMKNKNRQWWFKNKLSTNWMSKYTIEQMIDIKSKLDKRISYNKIRLIYDISISHLSQIKNWKVWKDLKNNY